MKKKRTADRLTRLARPLAFVAVSAAMALGCSSGTGPGPDNGDPDNIGVVRLQLTAPAGINCVQLQFAGLRTVTRDVTVSGEVSTRLDALPTGSVAITGSAYSGACGAGDPVWLSDPLTATLVAGRPTDIQIVFRKNGIAIVGASFVDDVPLNLALNTTGSGFPSPLDSDRGWGGGSYPWDIVDGLHSYNTWARGLAFTGGHYDASGGPPWIEPAGVRHAVIDFGAPKRFNQITIWWHGSAYTPQTGTIEGWDGSQWANVGSVQRNYGTMHAEGSDSGYSDSDMYTFPAVTASKVRYTFDNSGYNIDGSYNIHGWIYEFEVFAAP